MMKLRRLIRRGDRYRVDVATEVGLNQSVSVQIFSELDDFPSRILNICAHSSSNRPPDGIMRQRREMLSPPPISLFAKDQTKEMESFDVV
jgi:hypothetical protein